MEKERGRGGKQGRVKGTDSDLGAEQLTCEQLEEQGEGSEG